MEGTVWGAMQGSGPVQQVLNKEDTKIEQALLDLNDLKSEMYKDKKENSAGDSMRKTTM